MAAPMLITAEENANIFGFSDEEDDIEGFQVGDESNLYIE